MRALLTLALMLFSSPAAAADLVVLVKTPAGRPVADAVVTLHSPRASASLPATYGAPLRVDQRNMQFDPFVLIVPKGAEVGFPNRDAVRHHVYSFSPTRPFELKLYGRDETRRVRFDKAGTVALGCNIHDRMVAFIKVVDTPYATKTDASGRAVLRGRPAGSAVVRVWHPYLRATGNEIQVTTAGSAAQQVVVAEIRPPPQRRHHH